MEYPYGPLLKLLTLSGTRKSEAAEARWREFDLPGKLWTIPAERFKSDNIHVVPLTADMLAILEGLPRFKAGDHLFSTTWGRKPVNGFSKGAARLTRLMREELRGAELPPFVIHDIRRTVRSRLSALVPQVVAEQVIGHGRKGLGRVYDQYEYADEVRNALGLWGAKLRAIVTPPPDNVVPLRPAAAE
jgi:integrase